ncbi:FtsX-like permease family protein [Lentilactobacillus raoultii]|uniref:FtsX-like permease family protein n=1 Tax=Lentilactobacillus raoultii TaxID=1987503 RepID=A0ABW3PPA2_9LACO|nr:FtsX-like permease family protein [Lentilactobacillus raoultii]
MLRMIWLQFKYSQKVWAASLLLFIVTGFLTGVCLNGIFTIDDHYAHLQSAANLSALFYYPMIFGIITLFIVSSGVIKLVINSMRKDYTLWTILGANPNQLSLLIGGQLLIIGAIAAFIGFVIAVPFTVALSGWLSSLLGASQTANMPKLPFDFSIPACFWTISFISLTSGLAGYFHSHKLFINSQSNDLNFKKHHSKFQKIGRISLTVISAMGLLFCYGDSIILTPQARHYLINGSPHEAAKTYIPNLMLIMLFSIMLFSLLSPILLSWLIKLWTHLLPRKKSATTNTAFWHTLFDKNYLSSLIVPLFGGSFLLTGVNGVTSNITNGGGNQAAAANSLVSLVTLAGNKKSV